MSTFGKFRVRIWDVDGTSNRGRGNLVAIIDDAKDVGGSEYANAAGEAFFTIPWNHSYAPDIRPLRQHYEIARWSGTSYAPLFLGIVDDIDANENEVIVYGTDYLGQLGINILASSTSYTNTAYSTIIQDRVSGFIAGTDSLLGFASTGTIDSTSETTTVIAPQFNVLGFLSGLIEIYQSDSSVRPILQASRSYPPTFTFKKNKGSDKPALKLEYGGLVNGFRFVPGYANLYTQIQAIGQKREGAAVLYSTQNYADRTVYGYRVSNEVWLDIVNQDALDRRTKRAARRRGTPNNKVAISLRSGQLVPWDGYDLGDSLPVVINRGPAVLDDYFTFWGLEWIGKKDGSEDLFLNLLPKQT